MEYQQQQERLRKKSMVVGVIVTLAAHIAVLLPMGLTGLKYIYPPPQEKTILIEFEELSEQDPLKVKSGTQPRMENPDPSKHIELVKASEAQVEGSKANLAKEATVGEDGDVLVPEPPREKEINRRALFHSANNKSDSDTLAPQTAYKASDKLSEGHAAGNSKSGKTTGEPNAKLKGRQILGTLPRPAYSVETSGVVVVDILVNQYGEVTRATPGAEGTTVTDRTLWAAARNAAMSSHFNMAADAPVQQAGTITYVFKLR